MSQVRSFARDAQSSRDSSAGIYSAHMLTELLALHESMIAQLRMECLERDGAGDFLPRMIEQHETAAAMLVAQLRFHDLGAPIGPFPAGSGSYPPLPSSGNGTAGSDRTTFYSL